VSGPRTLVLVRHGVTDWNREGRFQGHLDPPLSSAGREEGALVAARLADDPALRPTVLLSSTLARASQTADAIARACGVEVTADRRLMELGQGEWEGRTHAQLAVDDAERYRQWRAGERIPPGAEPVEAALRRVAAAVDELPRLGDGPACIVSHGGTLRLLAQTVLELDPERAWALDVDNASLSVCTRLDGGGWRVVRWNDTRHLLGRQPTHVDEAEGQPLAL
jgi:broad specificity phosphatase PhoE